MSLSLSQVAAHAAKAFQQTDAPAVVAYAWPHGWAGGETITIGGKAMPLRHCSSPLEIREALSRGAEGSQVLLVAIPETELGQDVLARLFRHRLLHVDRWQLVQDAFGVHQVDPRLFGLSWLPDLLLTLPIRRASTAAALTFDEAMQASIAPVFALGSRPLDLDGLLRACESSSPRWVALQPEVRDYFREYLGEKLGPLARALLASLDACSGHAAIAIGLVCEVLYSPASLQSQDLRDARVRLEQRLNGWRLRDADARRWAELALRALDDRAASNCNEDFRSAMGLLRDVGAGEFAGVSSVLPESMDRRLSELGEAITKYLRLPAAIAEVESSVQRVLAHRMPPPDHRGQECAVMVARVCRSLIELSVLPGDLASDYLANGAWEDWARRTLRGARPEGLARSVTKLLDRLAERRHSRDAAFASRIAALAEVGSTPAGTLPIESALSAVVVPLAQSNPVLLVVLDGMSQDVYLAIASAMAERGWVSWASQSQPQALLATVPSVTECSRASLLAGRLMRGVAAQERQAFAAHEGLKRASKAQKPPLLLHKAGLEASHQLSNEATEAIGDTEQRVVGVVINAIDDALAKSEQVRIDWTLESIPLLSAVLDQARLAGRVVIVTSDHGHVLERQSVHRANGEGERWRRIGAEIAEGEIRVSGPRITSLMGEALIVPWQEQVRYGIKKNGYHGGVSRQEMLVPLGVWSSGESPASAGEPMSPAVIRAPAWWTSLPEAPIVTEDAVDDGIVSARPQRGADLFSSQPPSDWIDRLMHAPLLARQAERAGRMALDGARLRVLLLQLHRGGGRASVDQLAASIGQPTLRMRGIVSAMERMLNLDGYPVVTLEPGTGTVLLDVPLLKSQFLA